MKTLLFATTLLVLCGSAGAADNRITQNRLDELQKGRTTYAEIVQRFGRPNFLSKNWDGSQTASYAYSEGRSAAGSALPALGAVLGGGGESVVFYFDEKGVLKDYKANQAAARPAETAPVQRYVEPGPAGTVPPPASPAPSVKSTQSTPAPAQPAQAPPAGATPTAAAKPPPVSSSKPAQRDDGLPGWLPSSSTRGEDRY